MKILLTGSAGFIGSGLTLKLLDDGHSVIGIDNHNNYYDPSLKDARLERFKDHQSYTHYQEDIANREKISKIFQEYKFDLVIFSNSFKFLLNSPTTPINKLLSWKITLKVSLSE